MEFWNPTRRIREAPLCANTVDVIILSELSAAEKGNT